MLHFQKQTNVYFNEWLCHGIVPFIVFKLLFETGLMSIVVGQINEVSGSFTTNHTTQHKTMSQFSQCNHLVV